MKIKTLEIFGYGKWHDVKFSFNNGLQILYGKNESGKTTIVSLIKGILFGYQNKRTSYNQYVPKDSNSYGGQLWLDFNGNDYLIKRIKGSHGGKLTIQNDQGEVFSDDMLKKILGPIDRDGFDSLFYFGNVNLDALSKMNRNNLIERIQKIGLSNSLYWMDLNESLNKESKNIYAPNGYKPILNKKLNEYTDLLDKVNSFRGDFDQYKKLVDESKRLDANIEQSRSLISHYHQKVNELQEHYQYWNIYSQLKELDKIDEIPNSDMYHSSDKEQLNDFKLNLQGINNKISVINKQIDSNSLKKTKSVNLSLYNKNKHEIESLIDQMSNITSLIQHKNVLDSRIYDTNQQINRFDSNAIDVDKSLPFEKEDLTDIKDFQQQISNLNDSNDDLNHKKEIINDNSSRDKVAVNNKNIKVIVYSIGIALVLAGGFTINYWLILIGIFEMLIGIFSISKFQHKKEIENKNLIKQNVKSLSEKIDNNKNNMDNIFSKLKYYQQKYGLLTDNIDDWLINQNNLINLVKLRNQKKQFIQNNKIKEEKIDNYFKRWSNYLSLDGNYTDKKQQIDNYISYIRSELDMNTNIDNQINDLSKQLLTNQNNANQVSEKINQFLKDRNIETINQFDDNYSKSLHIIELKQKKDQLLNKISPNEIKVLDQFASIDEINKNRNEYNSKLNKEQNNLTSFIEQQTQIKAEINNMISNGTYNELAQRLSNLKTEINDMVDKWLTIKLSSKWIDSALNNATQGRLPKIKEKANKYFSILTNNHYQNILYYKSKIVVIDNHETRFDLGELSKGTMEQLYLSLIFALSVIIGQKYNMPIIIDDGFTNFDLERRKNAIHLLQEISLQNQIIYFSSDEQNIDNTTITLKQRS